MLAGTALAIAISQAVTVTAHSGHIFGNLTCSGAGLGWNCAYFQSSCATTSSLAGLGRMTSASEHGEVLDEELKAQLSAEQQVGTKSLWVC